MQIFIQNRMSFASPRKMKYPPESVIAIRKTPEEMAGSTLNLFRVSGIRIPARLARHKLQSMAKAMI